MSQSEFQSFECNNYAQCCGLGNVILFHKLNQNLFCTSIIKIYFSQLWKLLQHFKYDFGSEQQVTELQVAEYRIMFQSTQQMTL